MWGGYGGGGVPAVGVVRGSVLGVRDFLTA